MSRLRKVSCSSGRRTSDPSGVDSTLVTSSLALAQSFSKQKPCLSASGKHSARGVLAGAASQRQRPPMCAHTHTHSRCVAKTRRAERLQRDDCICPMTLPKGGCRRGRRQRCMIRKGPNRNICRGQRFFHMFLRLGSIAQHVCH